MGEPALYLGGNRLVSLLPGNFSIPSPVPCRWVTRVRTYTSSVPCALSALGEWPDRFVRVAHNTNRVRRRQAKTVYYIAGGRSALCRYARTHTGYVCDYYYCYCYYYDYYYNNIIYRARTTSTTGRNDKTTTTTTITIIIAR